MDEQVHNEEWMEKYREDFYDFFTLRQHASHIAEQFVVHGQGQVIEAYGVPHVNGKEPAYMSERDRKWLVPSINITVIDEEMGTNTREEEGEEDDNE
jgi:hypothetical protein